ncbi:MAG: glycosyltransferase family 4 protein [Candidatus Bathyarchaeia archaeon]|jgi:glycosyltransferase involved in cell wall biosynthesis
MRIIQVTPRYYPTLGGVEAVVQQISELLVKKGHEVTVYTADKCNGLPRCENFNGVTVKRFNPLFGDPLYFAEPRFSTSLHNEKADIVHAHNLHTFPPLLSAISKASKSKLVLHPHYHRYGQTPLRHSLFELYQKAFYGLLFSQTNLLITNSTYEAQTLREDFPKIKNMVLIPEGLDTTEASSVQHSPILPKRILFVGVLKRYKNVHKLLEGFAFLVQNGSKDYRLIIVGDGPEREGLVSLASSLGIAGLVEWKHGLSRIELLREYALASVFVMLSSLESFSRVVYDALVIGVPTVVLNFGALSHLVRDGLAEGVDSLSKTSIAEALLNASENTYQRLSLNNDNFLDWATYVNRLVTFYSKL